MTEDVIRFINVMLCAAAFGGLVWRLLGRWECSSWLVRGAVSLLAALELIVAMATAIAGQQHLPLNPTQYAITVHALLVIGLAAWWPLPDQPPKKRTGSGVR